MLEFEIAALYYFINDVLGVQPYFEEVPEDMIIPCVFYPPPEEETGDFSVSAFATTFTLHVKVMAADNLTAAGNAAAVIEAICLNRKKIPLVDDTGTQTGYNFRIIDLKSSKVDEGVWQLAITWKRYTKYTAKTATLAQEFFFNGNYLGTDE
ncbi:MAG: hypothetical protein LUE92_13775 [Clostridiales bacterium]|nr:hypothetical protein [Clostridiales bacterium]